VGNQLAAQGYFEILSNSLTTPNYTTLSEQLKDDHNITMLNPLSNDLSVLRQSLLFSGLEALSFNINRKRGDLKLFEFGKTYHGFDDKRQEFKHLALFSTGNQTQENWIDSNKKSDFFFLKGSILSILERLGISRFSESPIKNDVFSEGLTIGLGKTKLVDFGLVKKPILKHFDISQEVLFANFYWDAILDIVKRNKITFKNITKYPEVKRDFALLLDDNITFEAIYKLAKQSEKQLLKNVNLFDVYQGKNLPKGKKSYAVSFTLQDENKTLTDKQIDKIMNKLQSSFETQLGAELR
ncbi:MAG: phenylalanine--tRNA ligase subunit beta, partial [Flavobacteriaceae bacterium]